MADPARQRPRIRLALPVLAAAILALAIAGWIAWPSLLRAMVIKQARAHGVEIDPAAISWKPGEVQLRDPRIQLAGVQGFEARAEALIVTLAGTRPVRIQARGVHVDAVGDGAAMAMQVSDWTRAHATSSLVPVEAQIVEALAVAEAGKPPWGVVEDAAFSSSDAAWQLTARRMRVAGSSFEPVVASWKRGDQDVTVAVGAEDPSAAPIRLDVSRERPLTVQARWKPMSLADIATMVGATVKSRPMSIGGKVKATWLVGGAIDGNANLELNGFVPPHPRELDGIVFGDRTTVSSRFLVTADRSRVTLGDVKVGAGSFLLTGGGAAERTSGSARVDLRLTGPIACSALARSAARERLGTLIGGVVGDLARRTLTGTLGVSVTIRADMGDLEAATVEPSVSGRCGVKLLP